MNGLTIPENTKDFGLTSRTLAELTGKEHKHVLRDIDEILSKLNGEIDPSLGRYFKTSTYVDSVGRTQRQYVLGFEACLLVITGYDVVSRAKVIRRWQQLEQVVQTKQEPISFEEAGRRLWSARTRAEEELKLAYKILEERKAEIRAIDEQIERGMIVARGGMVPIPIPNPADNPTLKRVEQNEMQTWEDLVGDHKH